MYRLRIPANQPNVMPGRRPKHPVLTWVQARGTRLLEPGVGPVADVIEGIPGRIRILAGRRLAALASVVAVQRAFDDDEVLVLRSRALVHDLMIADELVSAHGHEQRRDLDRADRAGGGIDRRAVVDIEQRIPRA